MEIDSSTLAQKHTFNLLANGSLLISDVHSIDLLLEASNTRWIDLFDNVLTENNLTPYPYLNLKNKWLQGKAIIVLDKDKNIISYLSLNDFRLKNLISNFDYNIYETATGWTNKLYRGKGINYAIRNTLINSFKDKNSLFFSFTRGKGASSLLKKLEWNLILWHKYPFVSSFIGWFVKPNLFYKSSYGLKEELGSLSKSSSDNLNFKSNVMYLWTSDIRLVNYIEIELSKYLDDIDELHLRIMEGSI